MTEMNSLKKKFPEYVAAAKSGIPLLAMVILLAAPLAAGQSLSSRYPGDRGMVEDPDVLVFLDFDDEQQVLEWSSHRDGYSWTSDPAEVFAGEGALEVQQRKGTHKPYEIMRLIENTDVAYVRWYRKWQDDYDFTQHKMPGVYARSNPKKKGGAGEVPTGYDKFSCKLYVSFGRHPRLYTYHPEQKGIYGDGLVMNLVEEEYVLQAGRWYCFEMMIRANTPGERDGELKMWVDGKQVAHYQDMRFRDTPDLLINQFIYSAYVGGKWVSKKDQKLWDDQIVVARRYIGPMQPRMQASMLNESQGE